jgi:hypothetical protein
MQNELTTFLDGLQSKSFLLESIELQEFLDPAFEPAALTVFDAVASSWLQKHGTQVLRTWGLRYCIVTPHHLYYYGSPKDWKPRGSIPLQGATVSDVAASVSSNSTTGVADRFSFQLTPRNGRRAYEWRSYSRKEAEDVIAAIRHVASMPAPDPLASVMAASAVQITPPTLRVPSLTTPNTITSSRAPISMTAGEGPARTRAIANAFSVEGHQTSSDEDDGDRNMDTQRLITMAYSDAPQAPMAASSRSTASTKPRAIPVAKSVGDLPALTPPAVHSATPTTHKSSGGLNTRFDSIHRSIQGQLNAAKAKGSVINFSPNSRR